MSKRRSNKETKKPKKPSDGTKKKKKDPNRYDGPQSNYSNQESFVRNKIKAENSKRISNTGLCLLTS